MSDERRRFFRVDDEAEVSFKAISKEEYQAWGNEKLDEEREELAKLETELGIALSQLKSQQPQLAKICELLNQKLNLLTNDQPRTKGHIADSELKAINLSACGIAFQCDENIQANEHILLQLKLRPSNVSIVTTGKVVASESSANGKSIIRVDFQELGENHQDLLMQHLFHVQSRELKRQRSDDLD
jgi:hypothetical protein